MNRTGRVIGLDLGSSRIGVAVSDGDQRLAVGIDTIARSGDPATDHKAIEALVADYDAVGVVVGLPLSLSGRAGPAATAAREEISALRGRIGVDVETIDERFSTVAASGALRSGGHRARKQRQVIDRTAAAVLLQSWLDRRSGPAGVMA